MVYDVDRVERTVVLIRLISNLGQKRWRLLLGEAAGAGAAARERVFRNGRNGRKR